MVMGWSTRSVSRGRGTCTSDGFGGDQLARCQQVNKKTEPGSSQWCMLVGQEAMDKLKQEMLQLSRKKTLFHH